MTRIQTEQTISRHWEILQMLPSRRPGMTTEEIESQLNSLGWNTRRRTIQRDLISLQTIFPLECNDKSKPFGWYWMPNHRIELPGFSVPEALSLQLIEEYMKSVLPLSIVSVLESQFQQAKIKLNAVKSDNKFAGWLDKVKMVSPAMPQIPPTIDISVLTAVQDALINEHQIKVSYQKPQSNKLNEWHLHPLGLVQRGAISYLICTIFDYGNPILCAIHRIKSIEILKVKVNYPANFCLDKYIEHGGLQFGGGKPIKLEAIVHPLLFDYLIESPLSKDMKTSSKNGVHKIKATVIESWQFNWWIRSQGSMIEVVKPISLRNKIEHELVKTLKNYSLKLKTFN